jgi:hypothetical protein
MATKLKAKDPKSAEPSKPKMLVYGKPGVGKTWTALDFPNVYYIDTEGGADLPHYTDKLVNANGVYMGPSDGTLDFKTVIDQFRALATEKHDYKTVVVDSISKLFNTCVADEANRLGDKNAFGADKKPAIAYMRQLVAWVNRLDMNVLFIAHSKSEWGLDSSGQRSEIGQTYDGWDKLSYELHLSLEVYKQGPERKAAVRKSRLTGFPDAHVFEWSYAKFAALYGKSIIESKSTTITLASADQVAEVKRLVEVLRFPMEDVEKWFTKAGATSFDEMTTEQVAKCIEHLKGLVK